MFSAQKGMIIFLNEYLEGIVAALTVANRQNFGEFFAMKRK